MSIKKSYKTSKYFVAVFVLLLALALVIGCGKETAAEDKSEASTVSEEIAADENAANDDVTTNGEADSNDKAYSNAKVDSNVEDDSDVEVSSDVGLASTGDGETTQTDSASAETIQPLSIEEQIRLLVDSKDVWYQEKSDKENSKIYYLVTDLDMNDRIEIIRCDYCALPEFCKNRFFEVSADYSSVEKMDYDVETMWANGEENGTSHGIANAPVPINCFWNKAGNRTTYYYIIPTREHEEGVETITQMSLGVNNTGKVFTDFTGYANMDTETGEITYSDYNGFECSQEEFEKSGFISYSVESGWQCDSVTWQTVVIDDTTDMYESLMNSYTAYAHNPVNRAY